MDSEFISIAQRLASERGKNILLDPTKCKAFLNDYAKGGFERERRLLMIAIETGAPKKIANAIDLAACKKTQIKRLKEERCINETAACEIVDLLASLLRGDNNQSIATPQNRRRPLSYRRNGAGVLKISARGDHFIALTGDGRIYVAGYNEQGQLGLGDNTNRLRFTEVLDLRGVIAISAGSDHSVALTDDGRVYVAGNNYYGRLGLGDNTNRLRFTEVPDLRGVIAISAGSYHSLALTDDGRVYVAGNNKQGQLGLGDDDHRASFTEVIDLRGVIAISAGSDHSVALTGDGKVYVAGNNKQGQLGLGDKTDRANFTEASIFQSATGSI
ncbi:MAG: hypothetical protein LBF86_03640 [Helicobacteraceae bacterium]|jgi:alpha-tubulin suppressor-like RCC1 family protein|nr:hypothetical protein [Helicobacteraceae bacterium]